MKVKFENNEEYDEFRSELKNRLEKRQLIRVSFPEYRESAVAILLMNKDSELHVFLTKRTQKVGTHKGEVSFPGGARDPEDSDITATALRETSEEAGIKPGDIEILGMFDEYYSMRKFHVSTIVGAIKYPYTYSINPDEIESFVETPFAMFCNKEYFRADDYEISGRKVKIYYYSYNGYTIWGLTARILTDFAEKVLAN